MGRLRGAAGAGALATRIPLAERPAGAQSAAQKKGIMQERTAMIRIAMTIAAVVTFAAPAAAEDWDFILVNNTGKTIKTVEVSAGGAATWVANKIDTELTKEAKSVKPNGKMTVHFDKGSGCKYDLKATFDDGASAVWSAINVCDNAYVTLNYANGAPTFKAS
jgi:hypothetical protein